MDHHGEHNDIAGWLVERMRHAEPQPPDVVRLVGVHVLDPELASELAARTSWIGDGSTVREVLERWRDECHRFDAVAAVNWPFTSPEVVAVIVNP
jgi:hypothetical protein